jgi:MFS family permease
MHIVDRFGAGDVEVGKMGAVILGGDGSCAWAGGLIADRFPKRILISSGLLVLALASWLIPYMPSIPYVYLLGGIAAAAQIFVFPANFGLLAETIRGHSLSRTFSMNGLCLLTAAAVAAFLVGRLMERYGPVTTFHTSAVVALAVALAIQIVRPRPPANPDPDPHGAQTGEALPPLKFRRPFFLAVLALNFTAFFINITNQVFLVRLAQIPDLAMTLSEQSNVHTLRMVGGMAGYGLGVLWVGWHWRRWLFAAVAGWLGLMALISGSAPSPWILAAAMCLCGLAISFSNQMSLYYAVGSGVVSRGRGAGLTESALALGGGTGPLIGGYVAALSGTPRAALLIGIVPVALSLLISWRLLRLPNKAPDSR